MALAAHGDIDGRPDGKREHGGEAHEQDGGPRQKPEPEPETDQRKETQRIELHVLDRRGHDRQELRARLRDGRIQVDRKNECRASEHRCREHGPDMDHGSRITSIAHTIGFSTCGMNSMSRNVSSTRVSASCTSAVAFPAASGSYFSRTDRPSIATPKTLAPRFWK